MGTEARDRAIDFMRAIDDACAESLPACPGGRLLLDSRHALLWSANHLRVEAAPAPEAAQLDAAAAAHLDALGFRMIVVLDEAAGRALEQPLTALGYQPAHELLMVLAPAAPAEPPSDAGARVVQVAPATLEESRVAAQAEVGRDAAVGRQLQSRDALIGAVVGVRHLAVLAGDGTIAARVQIYGGDPVAQIENMWTARSHRGRGLARLLMRTAVSEARAAGAELVFLVADASDWPQTFYRRLGFADAGLLPRFLRS
jgi:ribosomal protein S18 acetylase RimI-like enzyme